MDFYFTTSARPFLSSEITWTAWAVRAWKEWADERNSKAPANEKVEPDICKVSDGHWLAKFVVEVRKKATKGECYPPNTLYISCVVLCYDI
jgi:hypothetical protein